MTEESGKIMPHREYYGVEFSVSQSGKYQAELLEYPFSDWYVPAGPGPYPTAILIHGGYWRARYGLDLMDGLARDLAQRGIAVCNMEYRRVGNPGGGWPGTFDDAKRVTRILGISAPRLKLDLKRVVAIGHSAGGHLAFWLAAQRFYAESLSTGRWEPWPFAGVISLAGVLDLHLAYQLHLSNDAVVELLGATPEEAPERYAAASPAALLPLGVPQVVIHGDADVDVPLEVSQRYVAEAQAAGDPVRYLELPGVDHFDLIDPQSPAWAQTLTELERLIG